MESNIKEFLLLLRYLELFSSDFHIFKDVKGVVLRSGLLGKDDWHKILTKMKSKAFGGTLAALDKCI